MPIEEEVQLTPEEVAAATAGGNEPKTIPVDALPEDLRNKSPEEIKATLAALTSTIGKKNDETEELRRRLVALEGRTTQPAPRQIEEDPDKDKPLEELIVTKPKVAIQRAMQELGYADRFESVERTASSGASEAAFMRAGSEFRDFADYEDDVKEILKSTNTPASYANVRGAYFMARGARSVESEGRTQRASAAANGSETPTPRAASTKKVRKLTPLEREIARGQGFTDDKGEVDEAEYLKWYDNEYMEVDVPTGKAK